MQRSQDQKNQINGRIETGHFLHSKEWEEFQRSLGREAFRVGETLATKLPLAFGKSYLYSAGFLAGQSLQAIFAPHKGETPSTPLLHKVNDSPLKSQKWLVNFAQQHKTVFLKYEPMRVDGKIASELLQAGFVKSKKEIQPQKTIVLDISGTDDEVLKRMHEKTRYNIRLAEKKNLRFTMYDVREGVSRFEEFWSLIQKTAQRDKFSTHTKSYYQQLLALSIIKLLVIELDGRAIAANIILFHGDIAYYLHGASDYKYRSFMAPYLLHWETIKYAKANGYKKYDFWGIDEKKWPGVTRFKRGFGGKEVQYIGSFDYVFQPFWYRVYNLRNAIKKVVS